ncbi:MAG: hypothetical protein VR64_10205 [Desulfatitalea sp. BRH_c12]|nr:MAG: hypothetical protein VR64_10205 [Desulfatitalea sp. BRH_c12]
MLIPSDGTFSHSQRISNHTGFTLIELMIVTAILATLAAIAVPMISEYARRARTARAIQEIRLLQGEITAFEIEAGGPPADLSEIDRTGLKDPWGHPYQYQRLDLVPKGRWRKDKFLVPINSTYDLWSMGPDGESAAPLTAKKSQDDIIRANDGSFVGRASSY